MSDRTSAKGVRVPSKAFSGVSVDQLINPAIKDPKKGNAGYRRQSLIFLDAGSESGMTGWYI